MENCRTKVHRGEGIDPVKLTCDPAFSHRKPCASLNVVVGFRRRVGSMMHATVRRNEFSAPQNRNHEKTDTKSSDDVQ